MSSKKSEQIQFCEIKIKDYIKILKNACKTFGELDVCEKFEYQYLPHLIFCLAKELFKHCNTDFKKEVFEVLSEVNSVSLRLLSDMKRLNEDCTDFSEVLAKHDFAVLLKFLHEMN